MHSPWHWMKGVAILLTLTSHNQFLKSIYVQYYKIRNLSTLDAQKLLIQVWFFTNSKEWKIRFLLNWEGKTISVPTIFKVWNYLGCTFVQFVYLKFIKIKIFMPLNLVKIQILMMLLSDPNQNLQIQMAVTLQICILDPSTLCWLSQHTKVKNAYFQSYIHLNQQILTRFTLLKNCVDLEPCIKNLSKNA